MFVVLRKYVRGQGFCDVNLQTSLLRQATAFTSVRHLNSLFPALARTRFSPPVVLATRAGRPPRGAGRLDRSPRGGEARVLHAPLPNPLPCGGRGFWLHPPLPNPPPRSARGALGQGPHRGPRPRPS